MPNNNIVQNKYCPCCIYNHCFLLDLHEWAASHRKVKLSHIISGTRGPHKHPLLTMDFLVSAVFIAACQWSMCFLLGAVSAGGNVSIHGSAAGPSWSVEPAGTQPVCSGHHGCGMGKDNLYFCCTVDQLSMGEMGLLLKKVTVKRNHICI